MKKVTIYTDGACLRNPGPGGWGAILEYGASVLEIFGGEMATTNNRMEMQAAIEALSRLNERCEVDLYTDSEYLRNGITKWIWGWKRTGWKKAIKNKELWQQLDTVNARHKVSWHWVKGHAGHPKNERCDVLATAEAARIKKSHTSKELAAALDAFERLKTQEAAEAEAALLK